MNEDETLKHGRLPVKVLAPRILDYFQKISPDLAVAIKHEIDYNELKPTIVYNNNIQEIQIIAQIDYDHEITIDESFLAFLWCLSYAVVTFYSERDPATFTEPVNRATQLLDYGLSLFNQWSSWDLSKPNPQKPDSTDKYIDQANAVMIFASVFILCHEFAHQHLGHLDNGHTADTDELKEDEFAADSYATSATLDTINYDVPSFEHTVKIALVVGIGSILFVNNSLSGDESHPDTDLRIIEVINKITNNDPNSEYWVHAIVLLNLWELIYRGSRTEPSSQMTAKEHFEWLADELK